MKTIIKFILYIRKSTDETKRQVLSLDAQMRELRELAKRERLVIVDVVEESRTAKEPGRPLFNEMLDRIENGDANGIIVWDIDRLYRNPADEGRVRWMLQRGIIASIRTQSRCYFPADAGLLIAIEGGRATDFIIHHKRDVARGVHEKLLRGEWPGGQASRLHL
jgi:site-specific DNA recombinase